MLPNLKYFCIFFIFAIIQFSSMVFGAVTNRQENFIEIRQPEETENHENVSYDFF